MRLPEIFNIFPALAAANDSTNRQGVVSENGK